MIVAQLLFLSAFTTAAPSMQGVVLDPLGKPASDVRVWLTSQDGPRTAMGVVAEGKSSSDGRFDLTPSTANLGRSLTLLAWSPTKGFGWAQAWKGPGVFIVRLEPAGNLSLKVTDPNGKPMSGVKIWPKKVSEQRKTGPPRTQIPEALGLVMAQTSAADGTVTFRRLPLNTTWEWSVGLKDLRAPVETYKMEPNLENPSQPMPLKLEPIAPVNEGARVETVYGANRSNYVVTARVVDEKGKPIAGSLVQGHRFFAKYPEILTDANGYFTVGIYTRETLIAFKGGKMGSVELQPTRPDPFSGVPSTVEIKDIVLNQESQIIRGVLKGANGTPVADAVVKLSGMHRRAPGNTAQSWTNLGRVPVGNDGRFEILGLSLDYEYRAHVESPSYEGKLIEVDALLRFGPSSEPETIVLKPRLAGKTVRGVVVNSGGKPVSGALVTMYEQPMRFAVTDAVGKFEIRDIPIYKNWMYVDYPGWERGEGILEEAESSITIRFPSPALNANPQRLAQRAP